MAQTITTTRKHSPVIRVCCLPEEKTKIEYYAKSCGLSVSSYLRNLGCNYLPKSVLELARINANLEKLQEHFGWWIANKHQFNSPSAPFNFGRLMEEIAQAQQVLAEKVRQL